MTCSHTVRDVRIALLRLLAFCALLVAGCAAAASERVALLVGNNSYQTVPLRNAVNDARDFGETLRELGFRVVVRENASRQDMIDAIREFGSLLDGAQVALFFYAGHAIQFKDRNFLIPVDASFASEDDVTFTSLEVSQIFDRMERARTRFNFVILDACRNNPFANSFRVTSSGLAQMSAPSGTLIAYATSPGAVAADGFGRNGIYTTHILRQVRAPDLPAEIMFKRVREGVERETKRLQTPWDSSSLKGDFSFNPTAKEGMTTPATASPDAQLAIEREFWISVRDSNRLDDIQAYLDKYPNGQFTALARNRIETLLHPGKWQLAAATPVPQQRDVPRRKEDTDSVPLPRDLSAAKPAHIADGAGRAGTSPTPAETQVDASPAGVVASHPSPESVAARGRAESHEKDLAARTDSRVPEAAAQPLQIAALATTAPPPQGEQFPSVASGAAQPAPSDSVMEQTTREREVKFADGSTFRGEMRGAVMHGSGEFVSADGLSYRGDFKDGKFEGVGVFIWPSGDLFDGDVVDGKPHGSGTYTFANGDRYSGEILAGIFAGRGAFRKQSGDIVEGTFVNGRVEGIGVYRFASGNRYDGALVHGEINGKGKYYFAASGDTSEGEFINGVLQSGIYTFSNGDRYEGQTSGGVLTGNATYYYADGRRFQGELVRGKPNGSGIFWFADGTRFEGVFRDGLESATGEWVSVEGVRSTAQIVGNVLRITGR